MEMFTQYAIKETDTFDEQLYPRVAKEIVGLRDDLREVRSIQKTPIIIAVLKDHSIKTEWLDGNKRLASLLTSGLLRTSHLELLFSSCRHNAKFLSGLEAYISTKLA